MYFSVIRVHVVRSGRNKKLTFQLLSRSLQFDISAVKKRASTSVAGGTDGLNCPDEACAALSKYCD